MKAYKKQVEREDPRVKTRYQYLEWDHPNPNPFPAKEKELFFPARRVGCKV